jgi:hypothetical protein
MPDVEEEAAGWRRRVDPVGQAAELNPTLLQISHKVD